MEKNILENISLIASVISAVTAVTTSLRALGKSRENKGSEIRSRIGTGSRLGDMGGSKKAARAHSLHIHLISTVIWFVLSAVFAFPLFARKWSEGADTGSVLPFLPFFLLLAAVILIWRKALQRNN